MATDKFNGFLFNGPKLDDFDFPRIGHQIGVGEDVIHGVLDVEAAGKSTDSKGRLKMLFEPHKFWAELGPGTKRDKAVKAGLAYQKWKPGAYPADSYPRLAKAMEIDERAAIAACSWGFPQILGSNFELAGFDSPQDMVMQMQTNEDVQLQAMINFIKNAGLDDELRAIEAKVRKGQKVTPDDCRAFVRGYNGKEYAKNDYHTKLSKAINKWMKIPDTPWSPEDVTAEQVVKLPDYKNGKFHSEVEAAQKRLDELGYHEVGSVDGRWGRKTETAILAFRLDNDLPLVPDMDAAFLAKLMTGSPRPISEARAKATIADLREAGSTTIKAADKNEIAGYTTIGLGGVGVVAKAAEYAEGYSGPIKTIMDAVEPIKGFITDNILIILLGVGAVVVWQTIKIKKNRLEEHQTAKNVAL